MFGFHFAPYTDYQQKNLDWIIHRLKELDGLDSTVEEISSEFGTLQTIVTGLSNTVNTLMGRVQNLEAKALPAVTAADNGKLLQVVSGAWTAVLLDGNDDLY